MDYLLNPYLLQIPVYVGNYNNSVKKDSLYYQWQAKNARNKTIQYSAKLKLMLQQINQQEKISQQKKHKIKQRQFNSNQYNDFYEYNILWKNKIDHSINNQRLALKQIQDKNQSQMVLKANNNTSINQKIKNFGNQKARHKGPILAWQQHFNQYMRAKNTQYFYFQSSSKDLFHPKINKKSQKITKNFNQPVQQRLIQYGQKLKIRKQAYEQQLENQNLPFKPKLNKKPDNNKNSFKKNQNSQNSNIFNRLYKQAQVFLNNKTQNQMKITSMYDFKPKINANSEQMEIKVKSIRQNKPLYIFHRANKALTEKYKEPNSNTLKIDEQETTKIRSHHLQSSASSQSFINFLKRNEVLLNKRKKLQEQNLVNIKKKQEQKQKKCTFSPILNSKSVKIFESRLKSQKQYQRERIKYQSDIDADTRIQTTERARNQSHEKNSRLSSNNGRFSKSSNYCQGSQSNSEIISRNKILINQNGLNEQSSIIEVNTQNGGESYRDNQKSYAKMIKLKDQYESSYYGQTQIIGQILNEQDSLEKGKQNELQWQSQIKNVEDKIQEMMKRALKNTSFSSK